MVLLYITGNLLYIPNWKFTRMLFYFQGFDLATTLYNIRVNLRKDLDNDDEQAPNNVQWRQLNELDSVASGNGKLCQKKLRDTPRVWTWTGRKMAIWVESDLPWKRTHQTFTDRLGTKLSVRGQCHAKNLYGSISLETHEHILGFLARDFRISVLKSGKWTSGSEMILWSPWQPKNAG